jgi:hypothetical protein
LEAIIVQYKVKSATGNLELKHAGEIGTEYYRDTYVAHLEFEDGDKCCYSFDDLEPLSDGGLASEEKSKMDDLVSAWNKFIKLERQHPSDIDEFGDGINRLQGLLAMRPLRRQYPEYWKSYKD